MKNTLAVFFLFALISIVACKKDEPDPPTDSDNSDKIPVLTTIAVSSIMQTTASCGGEVTSDGGYTVTTRGVCWSTNQNPTVADNKTTDGAGAGAFTSELTGLSENTTYYIRAYATNTYGTGYGSTFTFTTLDVLTDVDGNDYSIVKIGDQIWMAENLKTTRYNDGSSIPLVTDSASWGGLTSAAYCWYSNNQVYYGTTYGALYNFYTVVEGNLCPTGWHVPTANDWDELADFAGGATIAGGKLKETGNAHWISPNTSASDEFDFTGLPAGKRNAFGVFSSIGEDAFWWTSTPNTTTRSFQKRAYYNAANLGSDVNGEPNASGFSVRCIKNQ